MITVAQVQREPALLAAALARRRLATEGGAYVRLLAETGKDQGPLVGVPIAVKDNIDIAGQPTEAGSAARRGVPPATEDAPVVARLRAAGAVLTGKTTLHEFAFGVTGVNAYTGTPANPRYPGCIPGGSSSGSAVAVAEGSAAIALGTDTGGSVRIPAALCGVVGIKPSFGWAPVTGVFPLAPSLDHVGVLAADLPSALAALTVLAPERRWEGPRPRRIGIDTAGLASSDPAIAGPITRMLGRLVNVHVTEVALPDPERVFAASTAILFSEAALIHRVTLRHASAHYGTDVRDRLLQGAAMTAITYLAALEERERLRAAVQALFAMVDAIVGPVVGIPAPPLAAAGDPAVATQLVAHTRLANLLGLPAAALPMPTGDGPIGVHVLAPTDGSLLAAAALLTEQWT